ncbi:MAG: type II toxin-antitoxin system RelE/ParE family toxin [Polyangiaceae bacterium]|nr:type II toxin-antitoxin system RelE/ParE family toxin [Polyangiaceae bacterium]MCW5792530.1 type II toxin-antitoxin system RelE/ParE family toxin [Polyangiaceae bacterium]
MLVVLTERAEAQFTRLPITIKTRVEGIFARLREWPEVSGAKAMRGDLAGYYRIRTGDWRVLFRVEGDVIVVRIEHRKEVYND